MFFIPYNLWFYLIFSYLELNARQNVSNTACKTPHRENGTCIPVKQCKPIIEYLKNISTASEEIIKMLTDYRCDFQNNDIMVCCPDGPIIIYNEPRNFPGQHLLEHKNVNLLPKECGALPGGNQIIGGTKTILFEFPWMALLGYKTRNKVDFRCGGSIINNRYILTAAHCVNNSRLVSVRCGEYNVSSAIDCEESPYLRLYRRCAPPVQDMAIEEVILHPNFSRSTISDDIALIRLAKPLNFNVENVKPICLPLSGSTENYSLNSKMLTVTGWGVTETGLKSAALLKADLTVTSQKYCQSIYTKVRIKLTNKQFCALGQNGKDSCRGDSGGPLQRIETFDDGDRYVQYGVVSFGPTNCGQRGFPGVYTKTNSYMNWILDNLKP